MSGDAGDVTPTFGQRCRRILCEGFYELMGAIQPWLEEEKMRINQILETLSGRLGYA